MIPQDERMGTNVFGRSKGNVATGGFVAHDAADADAAGGAHHVTVGGARRHQLGLLLLLLLRLRLAAGGGRGSVVVFLFH